MRKHAVVCLYLALIFALGSRLDAQNYVYQTGNPTFTTQIPIENGFINVNNGDIHIEIPLATQQQRGRLQLDEKLVYDSRIWKILNNGGYSWQPTNIPNSMGGWVFSSGLGAGTVAYNTEPGQVVCNQQTGSMFNYSQYWGWRWTDPQGTVHPFYTVSTLQYSGTSAHCLTLPTGTPSSSGYASDGSGYYLQISNYNVPTITDQQGNTYNPTLSGVSYPPSSSNLVVDSNGNYFSNDGNGNLVDTLGRTPVLVSTSGNQIYYDVLTYGGNRSRYTVTTETVYYHTAFAEQAVSEASGSFTAIESIQLPDGSSYSFTYDSGTSAGNYGELTSVTMPTGGVIQYTYTNFLDSFQNENRWLYTRVKDGGTTQFKPQTISNCSASNGCQEKTTVTNPALNDTVYTFTLDKGSYINAGSWNTGIDVYQGSSTSGGTKVKSVGTAYTYSSLGVILDENGTNYVIGYFQVPATITTTTTLDDVGLTSQTQTALNFMATSPSSVKQWDYYSGTAPSSPTTETDYTYYAALSYPSQVSVKDGSGNLISQTVYNYDQTTPTSTSGLPNHGSASGTRANLTTVSQWINTSGSTLNTTNTYDDAGALLTSTNPNGLTTYRHDSTDTFVTSTIPPTPSSGVQLGTSAGFDPSTGLMTSATDPNGQTTTYKAYDEFGRPKEIDYPDGGKTTFNYTPTQASQYKYQNASTYEDLETLYDSYGRRSRVAVFNGQSGNDWYQQDTCYNTNGNVQFQSYRYQSTGFVASKVCSGSGDTYTQDALDRTKSITHGDGSSIAYIYTGRATQTTDENGVKRITQIDGLGRTTETCEISSNSSMPGSGSPTNCGTDIAGTGFITSYAYSLANHTTTVTQGAQTRVFQTDFLGRPTLMQEPERGQTSYSYAYNSTGLVVTRQRPKANQSSSSILTTSTTQFDKLGRVLSLSYNDGVTTNEQFDYDVVNSAMQWSQSTTNLKGNLADMASGSGNTLTRDLFSYDPMGRVTAMWQCAPSICGTSSQAGRPLTFSYDWTGDLTSEADMVSGAIVYGYSSAGEVTSMTGSYNNTYNPPNLISSVQNSPNGPLNWQIGNGMAGVLSYDSLGRNNGDWLCRNSTAAYCTGGTKTYGNTITIQGTQVHSECDTVLNNCATLGYDEFNRLKSLTVTSGTQNNFSYVYDRYGNRWQQNITAGSGPSPQLSFNTANNQVTNGGIQYDAAGNLVDDSTHSYQYDAEGNLISVDNGSTAVYVYDALSRRIRVQTASATDEYIYDYAGRRISTWLPNGAGIEGRIYWGNRLVAFRAQNGDTYFDQKDALGTDRLRMNYAAVAAANYASLPFGDGYTANVSGTYGDQDNNHFAQLDRDAESDTDHALYRQYYNTWGRWMSPDPYNGSYDLSDPQSFNRYAYTNSNPLAFTDPSGMQWFPFAELTSNSAPGISWAALSFNGSLGAFLSSPALAFFSNPVTGIVAGAALGIAEIGHLAGWWGGPQFHGSLQPRPSVPQYQAPQAPNSGGWGDHSLAQQVFQGPGSGVFVGADTTVHGLAIATGAVAAAPFAAPAALSTAASVAPYAASAAASAEQALPFLGTSLYYNPAFWQGANDFLEGYAPVGPFPATYSAFAGAVASSWDTIWNDVTLRW